MSKYDPEKEKERDRDFALHHLQELLVAAILEADGNEKECRYLQARSKLRLITMSESELWALSRLIACSPEDSVKAIYKTFKENIRDYKKTAAEWVKDLQMSSSTAMENRKRNRVLIVASDLSLKRELTSAFDQADFSIVNADSYRASLEALHESRVDLIVMESMLPDGDGFEACKDLHNFFNVPVILLVNESSDEVLKKAAKANADHYELNSCKLLSLVDRAKTIIRRYGSAGYRDNNYSGS